MQPQSRFFRAPYFRIQLFTMPGVRSPETVALLMANFRQGDSEAASKLVELCYPELRRLAVGPHEVRARGAYLATNCADS